MTECKKDYILDALGELEDDLVAEAASYTKQKVSWKYWREMGAAAACVAAILVMVKTVEYLPIGRTTESMVSSENTNQSEEKENITYNGTGNEENEAAVLEHSEGIVWELVISETENPKGSNKQEHAQLASSAESISDTNNVLNRVQAESCLAWLSPEEILAQGYDIFEGVVTGLQVYHVTGKIEQYFTVATIEVTDSIRGTQQNGNICEIYLPIAKVDDMIMENSVSGDLDKLEVGSNAIFMPRTTSEDTGLGKKDLGEWLCYADFADYYFSEATRYLFLETESGVSYEKNVYEIPGENITLEDVAEYLRNLLED